MSMPSKKQRLTKRELIESINTLKKDLTWFFGEIANGERRYILETRVGKHFIAVLCDLDDLSKELMNELIEIVKKEKEK